MVVIKNFTLYWLWIEFAALILFIVIIINTNFDTNLVNLFLINIYCSLNIYIFYFVIKNISLYFLLIKNSLFPIIWIYIMWLYSLSKLNLLLFRTINKIPSFFMIREFFDYFYNLSIIIFRIFNTFLVAIFMLTALNTKILYLMSSLLNSNWLIIRAHSNILLILFITSYYATCAIFLLVENVVINIALLFFWSSLPGSPFFFSK